MKKYTFVTFDRVWAEIRQAYDTRFIEALIQLPGAHVYAFGGILTDLTLGQNWKDLDLRIIWDVPKEEQVQKISEILSMYTEVVQKVEFPGGMVIRVKEPTGKNMIIDIGVANNFDHFRADFKASGMFMDLKTGEVVELSESCVEDLEQGIIRALDDPEKQLESDPTHFFRALKFAAKTGFAIDPRFGDVIKAKKHLARRAITDVVTYLKEHRKDSIAEYFLGNIFGGLKSNANLYVALLEEYGLLEEICIALKPLAADQDFQIKVAYIPDAFTHTNTLEGKLSIFLSILAKSLSAEPAACFTALKSAFALDTGRSDGNEFAVKPEEVVFVP